MPITQRICLIACVAGLVSCVPERDSVIAVAPDDPVIRYTGRWNFDDAAHPWVGWQGSTVSLKFRGESLSADLEAGDEGDRIRIIVDTVPEEPARVIVAGKQSVVLAAGLDPDAEHIVTVMKEGYANTRLTFHGFNATASSLLPSSPRPEMRIAFFGDSNMEGYSLYDEKNAGENGTYFAYPATVSRMLGAEMYLQAMGSATLDGPTANDVVSFVYSEAYEREDPAYRDGFLPQVIVVNAGANDIYQVDDELRKPALKHNYRVAVAALRNVYGDGPHIILYNAYSWDVDEPASYSREIVDELGGNLSVLLFPWCWEQWHGDMVDHAGQANRLADYIVSLKLGFERNRDAEVVSGYATGFDVANGSFEGAARDGYGAFGWRYFEDGVERIHDPGNAAEGNHYIRLNAGELVHQCVDATGDFLPGSTSQGQQYTVTALIRSVGDTGAAIIGADYEQQTLYKRENLEEHTISVNNEWQDYSVTLTAPDGTWKTYIILKSESGDIEFDHVRMSAR